jgi:NADPH:quinone reductase and related Zn-dependent oxidoreductases
VLVTGAAGGVGSVAIAILSQRGFQVTASTGRAEEADYLKKLGAQRDHRTQGTRRTPETIGKRALGGRDRLPSARPRSPIAVDDSLWRNVAACGLAGGMDLPTSVAPFILRGVSLVGIDSVMRPIADRRTAWGVWTASSIGESLRP